MGEPYPEESSAFSYNHISLANLSYEVARQSILLYLLRKDVACTCKGGVYPNRFKKHAKYSVKNFVSRYFLGSSVPYLTVRPCLSQYFVSGSDSMTVQAKGGVFYSPLVVVMCKNQKGAGFNSVPGGYNPQLSVQRCTHIPRYFLGRCVSKFRSVFPSSRLTVCGELLCYFFPVAAL